MKTIEKIAWVQENSRVISGTLEQATTPQWLVEEMFNQVPVEIIKKNKFVDSTCGRGTFPLEAVKRKLQMALTGDETKDQKRLEDIIATEVYCNDIDLEYTMSTESSLRRIGAGRELNVDNTDALYYNLKMNDVFTVTNPPYQPPRGVKKGGNEYKKHVLHCLKNYPKYGVANIPMTFMVQDPFDHDNNKFKKTLLNAGLKKIKHVHPHTYAANVLTIYLVWEEGYTGPVEFQTYDVDDVKTYHKIVVDREELYDAPIWPVARTTEEFDLAIKVMKNAKKRYKYFHNNPDDRSEYCVDWEYLIGLEKERLNRKINIRNIKVIGPQDPPPRGGSLSKFFNCKDKVQADSLKEFLDTTGQEFMRTIPRGSSVENWMMGPLIEMWLNENVDIIGLDVNED